MWIIYHNPVCAALIEERGFIQSIGEHGVIAFAVYTNSHKASLRSNPGPARHLV